MMPMPRMLHAAPQVVAQQAGQAQQEDEHQIGGTALPREIPHRSIQQARMFSNTAVTVDRAAKNRNTKNSAPHSRPPGMALNTLGRVTKIRLGPGVRD